MTKSETVNASMALVVCCAIVEESSYSATLEELALLQFHVETRTLPPWVSTTSAKPSNWPTV